MTKAHLLESDADSIGSSVSQALRDKKVTLGGVDYRVVEVFKGDSLNAKPHWRISLVPEGAAHAVSYLVLNPIRAGSKYLGAEQIVTDEAYRRKGLATFLYLYTAERFGKPFTRSRKQSDLGADLWKGRLKNVFTKATQAVESLLGENSAFDLYKAVVNKHASSIDNDSISREDEFEIFRAWAATVRDMPTADSALSRSVLGRRRTMDLIRRRGDEVDLQYSAPHSTPSRKVVKYSRTSAGDRARAYPASFHYRKTESLFGKSEARYWTPEELELPEVEGDRGTFPRYIVIADDARTEIKSLKALRRILSGIYSTKPRVFVNAGKGITIDFDS